MTEKVQQVNLHDFHTRYKQNILLFYKGVFKKQIIASLSQYIENLIADYPLARRKLFKIFIELAQNIAFYSAEYEIVGSKKIGLGTVMLEEHENYFIFASGNKAEREDVLHLKQKCDTINSYDRNNLRKFKRDNRRMPTRKGGGNIGLIQIALTASSFLNYNISPVDGNYDYFTISVKVPKKDSIDQGVINYQADNLSNTEF